MVRNTCDEGSFVVSWVPLDEDRGGRVVRDAFDVIAACSRVVFVCCDCICDCYRVKIKSTPSLLTKDLDVV